MTKPPKIRVTHKLICWGREEDLPEGSPEVAIKRILTDLNGFKKLGYKDFYWEKEPQGKCPPLLWIMGWIETDKE